MATVQGRIYEDLRVVLNSVFKYALANSLISNNPMLLIPFKKAERNNRRSLTNDELKKLFERLNLPEFKDYKQTFLILLFFGLRPCELEAARFEEDFLIARNAKRKAGKIEYKKIPICNQARELLDLSAPIKALHRTDVLNRIFKRIMDDDTVTQYYLRHTFATVCQQYVRPDIVDIWMGDSSERLVGRVYTHFSDDFMLKQMQNVVFDFWLHKRQEPLRRIIPVKRPFFISFSPKTYLCFILTFPVVQHAKKLANSAQNYEINRIIIHL